MREPNQSAVSTREAAQLVPLRSITALGDLIQRSDLEPVVLFQHDPYCPISRRAYRELASTPIQAALVDVAEDDHLSRRIEQRTGVRHESPQVLLFRSGKVVWSASHFEITSAAVTRAMERAAADEFDTDAEAEDHEASGRCSLAPNGSASGGWNVLAALRSLWDQF
jgi:bacillithiol system protein YtxJ